MPGDENLVRLQKFLASAGFGSRRQCEEYILTGRVLVDGKVITELGTRVDPNKQEITLDDETIKREKLVYWFANKPKGVLSTTKDTHGRPTIVDLLPGITERVFPVGRLDEESTGLLLLTNDGDLTNLLTHPRYGVPKTYEVLVAGRINIDVIAKLKRGIWLSDGRARVHEVEKIGMRGEATMLRIVLREGHNREIRRLFASLEHKVMRLERVAIGPIKIRKLRSGTCRLATADEIRMLRELAERARLAAEQGLDIDEPTD
jgi:23S rRNA pseudouridine2605 synthase